MTPRVFILALLVLLSASHSVLAEDTAAPASFPLSLPAWLEDRINEAAAKGVTPFFSYNGVIQGNVIGGESREAAYSMETVYGVTLDLHQLLEWQGASLQVSGSTNAGRNLSDTIPNTFTVSQAYVVPTTLFYELFYSQELFEEKLQLWAGRLSAGDWFASLPAFGLQVQGGINGNPESLFLNSNFTSSPVATWGAMAQVRPSSDTYLTSGIYQATTRLQDAAYHGLDFSIRANDGILLLTEVGWTPSFGQKPSPSSDGKSPAAASPGLDGIYQLGGYYSTLPYDGFEGGTINNTYGFYLLAQQMLWRSAANPNIQFSLWAGVTYSPQEQVAQMPLMGMGGAIFQGLIPGRDQDMLLMTWLTGRFSPSYANSQAVEGSSLASSETVFELSYLVQLTPAIGIQPDLQYIIRPNGIASAPDVLVLGLQVICSF